MGTFDNNITYDLISLPLINSGVTEIHITRENLSESYFVDNLNGNLLPLTYLMIDKYHQRKK